MSKLFLPAFDVSAEKSTYKAGESVEFLITGAEAQNQIKGLIRKCGLILLFF